MRPILAALTLMLALPAAAQERQGTTMERGLRLFLDGLREEMEPALRDLQGFAGDAGPLLRELQRGLAGVVEEFDLYEAPEVLPNGDILLRRKPTPPADATPEPEPNPDGSIDL